MNQLPPIAEVLRSSSQGQMAVGFHSRMDDGGFIKLEDTLCNMAKPPETGVISVQNKGQPSIPVEDSVTSGQPRVGWPRWKPHRRRRYSTSGLCTATAASSTTVLHLCDIGATWQCSRRAGESSPFLPEMSAKVLPPTLRRRSCSHHQAKTSPRFPSLTTLRLIARDCVG